MNPLEASAADLAHAIRTGVTSSKEVVAAHIAVLQHAQPRTNALAQDRFERAVADAEAADAQVAAGGPLPPLLGVPCTIKESLALEGMPNCAGVVARSGFRATTNATVVQRVLDAGAIPLGVTNTSELCMWIESENRVYGRTSNAYDPSRIAGGSSGGEGAAIGSGGAPFGIGSDVGGSIRLPAFFNGVFGHKPTPGLVPNTGEYPSGPPEGGRLLAKGPLTRRATDLMPLLRLIAGPDGKDTFAQDFELGDPAEVKLDGLQVLISEDFTRVPISREMLRARDRAAQALADQGALIRRTSMRGLRSVMALYLAAMEDVTERSLHDVLVEAGSAPMTWRSLLLHRNSPHTVTTRMTLLSERLATPRAKAETTRLLATGRALAEETAATLGDGILLHPSYFTPAPRHGRTVGRLWSAAPTAAFNLLGLPVTQAPLGLNRNSLPLGVQVVAAPFQDHRTIAVAIALEATFGGWTPPTRLAL